MKNSFLALCLIISLTSCDYVNSIFGTPKESGEGKIVKTHHQNGKLKSYYTYNDLQQKHGTAKIFSSNGLLEKSFEFVNGEKVKAISYYKNGSALMEINYKNDVKDGLFKRFYDTGQLESEVEYKEDFPGKGLKEYTKNGKLKTSYPELIVKGIDQLSRNGKYIIEVYFDANPGRGTYYMGELTEGKFLNYRIDKLERSNYRGRLELQPAPGVVLMEKLNFIGEYKTPTGNKYIVEKHFNLAIDNTF